ncbi:uncharacterized protein RCC_02528 [Ramularia collo-cygni]|uniref:Trichothecene 3-O-acetyltransferase-like N-terminal domain-containing protein n=1 Tax=Ramularia collo-cygni TaxID=112498 RepID=A0A2D3V8I9_9PEZI|nr:uncharacterized protein RCC_02528 [Ramularia collo-cygni]CZT16693.1 uncharacterized protein RCC_02528 [Ramularia collo-cygni]
MATRSIFLTGTDPTLKLAPNDVWLPGIYSRRVLCFELSPQTSHGQVIDVFSRGLQALVNGTPELGATSVIIQNAAPHDPSQPWRALVPGKGIELVIKDLTKSFTPFEQLESSGFPIAEFKDGELMPIDGPIMPEPAAVSRFQLSFIDGGVLLSLCMYHHLSDGNGMNAIVRALAEECKKAGEQSSKEPTARVMNTSRDVFDNLSDDGLRDLSHHPAYDMVEGIFTPGAEHHEEDHPATTPVFKPLYYHLSHDKAEALKAYGSTNTPVSTHDAISAALWRNLIISRHNLGEFTDLSMTSTYTIPHNARKYLNVPETWVGYLTYFLAVQANIAEILEPDSLPLLAGRIRAALKNVTTKHVEGVLQLRKEHPYSLNWWPLWKADAPETVAFTSFYHSDMLSADWGSTLGGRARHFTTTDVGGISEGFQRVHYVGPMLDGGKGCFVFVGALEKEAEYFEKEEVWQKYFKLEKK